MVKVHPDAMELFEQIRQFHTKEELDLFLLSATGHYQVSIGSKNTGVYDHRDFMLAYADDRCGVEIRCDGEHPFMRVENFPEGRYET